MDTESVAWEVLRLSREAPDGLAEAMTDAAHAIFWLRGRVSALEAGGHPAGRGRSEETFGVV